MAKRVSIVLLLCSLAACAARPAGGVVPARTAYSAAIGKIAHVVVIMQENRSFDNLFHGFPGADWAEFGYGPDGRRHRLLPRPLDSADVTHKRLSFLLDYDGGRNDGWTRQLEKVRRHCPDAPNDLKCWVFWEPGNYHVLLPFSYVPRAEVEPYWQMAREYALSDRTFASNNGPSYAAHLFMIAGQARHVAEIPDNVVWGCDAPKGTTTTVLRYGAAQPPLDLFGWALGPRDGTEREGPFPCFALPSAADMLDAARVSWAYYAAVGPAAIWSAYDSVSGVRYGADWKNDVKSPEIKVLQDIAAGTLPQVAWVTPAAYDSDHAGPCGRSGPDWVASIVNAIGRSTYWRNTAIVVLWDEWGGWYDHVVPPQYPDALTGAYEGLGYRVPLIVISPYAKRHYVSHVQHEVASTLHFIEKTFGLGSLGAADARADALDDMFDFTAPPAAFRAIQTHRNARDFLRERPSGIAPDDD